MATYVYCGMWGEHGGNDGLWVHPYDTSTGALGAGRQVDAEIRTSNCYVDQERALLYMVDEVDQAFDKDAGIGSGGGGNVWVWQVDAVTGELTLKQKARSFGSNPSMFTLSPDKRYGVCSIHGAAPMSCQTEQDGDGSWRIVPGFADAPLVLFRMNDDGTLGEVLDAYMAQGAVLSHMHSCTWAPSGTFFVANDKGTGAISSVRITPDEKLELVGSPYQAGADDKPRYVRFHPTKPWCYVNYEAANRLDAFSYDDEGRLTLINSDLVVPEDRRAAVEKGWRFESQDMKISADGSTVYSCYRGSGDNPTGDGGHEHLGGFQGVAVYAVSQEDGSVTTVQRYEFDDLFWPRGCAISPDGKFLLVASLYSDQVATLAIAEDGTLSDTGLRAEQDTCSSVTFYAA